MPDYGKEQIMAAAQRMLDSGVSPQIAQEFINRAAKRLQANAADQASAKELSTGAKAASLADRALGGATFGLSGLATDALGSAIDPNSSFADLRQQREDRNSQLGGAGIAADLLGGLATGGASLSAIKGLANVGRAAKVGLAALDAGLQGGVTSAAEGLNDLSVAGLKRAGSRGLLGAGAGAVLGGTLGGAVGGIAARRMSGKLGAELVSKGVNVKQAEILAKQLAEASPNDIAAALGRVDEFVKAGRGAEVMAADVLGSSGQDLLRASANVSKKASDIAGERVRVRDAGIGDRKIGDLAAASGIAPADIASSVTKQIEDRSAAAAPLYDKFRNLGSLPVTDHLLELKKLPIIGQAIKTVKGESPELAKLPWNDARVLDAVYKRVGSRAFKATHGYEPGEARNQLLQAIDAASGGQYRPAVGAFADKSAAMDAYDVGTGLLGKSAGHGELALAEAGSEAPMVKRGLVDAMAGKIEAKAPNPDAGAAARSANGLAMEGAGTMQARGMTKTVLGDPAYQTLLGRGTKEAAFAKTSNALQGNSTTAKQASGINDLLGITADIASGFSLNPAWWATMTGRRLASENMNALAKQVAKKKAGVVADALTQGGQDNVRKVLEDILAEQARQQASTAAGRAARIKARTVISRSAGPND